MNIVCNNVTTTQQNKKKKKGSKKANHKKRLLEYYLIHTNSLKGIFNEYTVDLQNSIQEIHQITNMVCNKRHTGWPKIHSIREMIQIYQMN